ncbi:Oidioi.mRNA.OKI2018_I69.PAR.g13141.t1.cds [Oikopleura dioica]|uniref:Oidioi.mRNA.OKI2018_I69.PAR.g13141.t1.cds n=1 Tax=Oikopleura dioica TaxID=34765 RepID=A0ABN7S9E5_OIKDI|nr:Oidioi.mRNA.OKI2018_I69.PAR.g13141.t1.cds [Oikopleura dioica]
MNSLPGDFHNFCPEEHINSSAFPQYSGALDIHGDGSNVHTHYPTNSSSLPHLSEIEDFPTEKTRQFDNMFTFGSFDDLHGEMNIEENPTINREIRSSTVLQEEIVVYEDTGAKRIRLQGSFVELKDGFTKNSLEDSHAKSFQQNNNDNVDFHADNRIVLTDLDEIQLHELLPIQPVSSFQNDDVQQLPIQENPPEDNQVLVVPQASDNMIASFKDIFLKKHLFATTPEETRKAAAEFLLSHDQVQPVKDRANGTCDRDRHFQCDFCPLFSPQVRSFKTMEALWRHFCQHLGHFKFNCSHCPAWNPKGFYRQDKFDEHMKKKHPQVPLRAKRPRAANKKKTLRDSAGHSG